jgi:uncharacterized Zn finger protein (UPF0148 family)
MAVVLTCFGLVDPCGRIVLAAQAENLVCKICTKPIQPGGNYLKTPEGGIFCSDKCFQEILPTCSACMKKTARTVTIQGMTERVFCKICAEKNKCFCCGMPGDCSRLADGRYLCPECSKTAIVEESEIQSVAQEVRNTMKDKIKISTDHQIAFLRADINDLEKGGPRRHDSTELGRFVYNESTERTVTVTKNSRGVTTGSDKTEKVTRVYSIYLLYGMSRNKLIEVAAHELAHDWMQECYPGMNNLQVQEGWAEYAAAAVNSLYGHTEMNRRIQNNSSEIYGEGYRLVSGAAKKGGTELQRLFEKTSLTGKTRP